MAENLPGGWVVTALGDIVEPSRRRAQPREMPNAKYVGLEHIEPHSMRLLEYAHARDARSLSAQFSQGDVLYARMRPYLNKVWVAEFDGLCSAEFLVFPQTNGLNSRFLAARLNAVDFVAFANSQVSGERPRVSFEKLRRFVIQLPPSGEQGRIVAKLESALSSVAQGESAARRAVERVERYHSAVLDAAARGDLTRAWRARRRHQRKRFETGGEMLKRILEERRAAWSGRGIYKAPLQAMAEDFPRLPTGWTWATLDELCPIFVDSAHRTPKYGAAGIPALGPRDVVGGRLNIEHARVVDEFEFKKQTLRHVPQPGDIVYSRELSFGWGAIVPVGQQLCLSQGMCLFRPHQDVSPNYFLNVLNGSFGRKQAEAAAVGSAHPHINLGDIRGFTFPLPPPEEQIVIVRKTDSRLSAATELRSALEQQLTQARATRESLLRDAFSGKLVLQDANDESASVLLDRLRLEKASLRNDKARWLSLGKEKPRKNRMEQQLPSPQSIRVAWERIGRRADARLLFTEGGFSPEHVVEFYEALRLTPDVCAAFQDRSVDREKAQLPSKPTKDPVKPTTGRFRLVELWIEDFRNLKDYTVRFNPAHALDVILGWNGTGKSNLFEALVLIFRDLHSWVERNRWPDEPFGSYRLRYELNNRLFEITWSSGAMKRPETRSADIADGRGIISEPEAIKREQLALPRFVFGYYSGPTNRLAEHFLPMKQAHYDRLREAKTDDPKTLATLLEQRRFFCAETDHAKYVLLAFSYKEDPEIRAFLEDRLRITGFESALFIIRKPRWAKSNSRAEQFWDATGIMRRVMERLRRYAIAPIVLEQTVRHGYRSATEDHYYFFLPDLQSLTAFAAEYQDARTFFLALESTDFSELIYDVKIQVRVKASQTDEVAITFRELSEGEQQLLMVLGLLRFTKANRSLVLLDEPDTHLNPQWSIDYLKLLTAVMDGKIGKHKEEHTSQLLVSTHDPLVIASLVKEQIHLLKREPETLRCYSEQPREDPRGLGFTGILLSDMFGFRSDLDPETLALLDTQVELAGKDGPLTKEEAAQLSRVNVEISRLGFKTTSSDPYYRAFIEALARRREILQLMRQPEQTVEERERIGRATDEVLAELADKHALKS